MEKDRKRLYFRKNKTAQEEDGSFCLIFKNAYTLSCRMYDPPLVGALLLVGTLVKVDIT